MDSFTTIITHPDNEPLLRRTMAEVDGRGFTWCPTIKTNRNMERDKPTGKYTLPDGRTVERDQIRVSSRFIDYGPEDAEHLAFLGVIREHREPLFYTMDESKLNFTAFARFGAMPVDRHRVMIASTA